jgi:hypothetical protein
METSFEQLKPRIKGYAITAHFKRDMGSIDRAAAIAIDILESQHDGCEELHKYEEHLEGNHIFRAKIKGVHIVYAITAEPSLVFLRGFKNFKEYKHFLEDRQAILSSIANAKL